MPKRGKGAVHRQRRRQQRLNKRSYSNDSSDGLNDEIQEVFDQMDFIYGELEVVVNADSFMFSNAELSDLDASLDYVYEQIGKWLVGYCGCLVQREQTGIMDNEALENLLDRLLGICYQMDSWIELVDSVVKDPCHLYGNKPLPPEHKRDATELRRRRGRVLEVQTYLTKVKERHSAHLVVSDHRPFSALTENEKDRMAFRFSRYMQASFPSTTIEELSEMCGKVEIGKVPIIQNMLPFNSGSSAHEEAKLTSTS